MNLAAISRRGGDDGILNRAAIGRRIQESPSHLRILSFPRLRKTCTRFSAAAAETPPAAQSAGDRCQNFYDLLGISPAGGAAEIKKAYKELARKYHPDVSPSSDRTEEYTRRFIELKEAYETLSDPHSRALYDRHLAGGLHLAFSSRRRHHPDEELKDKTHWRNRWQDQVKELKRRGVNKDQGNLSWGARMRQKKAEDS